MKEDACFDIYEPSQQKFKLSRNVIIYFLLGIVIVGYILPFDFNKTVGLIYAIGLMATAVYFSITSLFSYQPLYGKISGKIEFKTDSIIVDGYKFNVSEISLIDFYFKDFHGKLNRSYKGNFNQLISQDVQNYVQITDIKNKTYVIYFRFLHEQHHKALEPFIEEYFHKKKMTFNRRYNLERTEFSL